MASGTPATEIKALAIGWSGIRIAAVGWPAANMSGAFTAAFGNNEVNGLDRKRFVNAP